jgi:chromosome segregation ATPase
MSFEDPHGALERRRVDPTMEMIAHKVVNMEQSMNKLTEAITKLAVIEEKQATDRAALERAFMAIQKTDERCSAMFEKCVEKLEKTDNRVDALEQIAPSSIQTNEWVTRALWAAAALGATLLAGKLGFILS